MVAHRGGKGRDRMVTDVSRKLLSILDGVHKRRKIREMGVPVLGNERVVQ
jgi:hypothetical protein